MFSTEIEAGPFLKVIDSKIFLDSSEWAAIDVFQNLTGIKFMTFIFEKDLDDFVDWNLSIQYIKTAGGMVDTNTKFNTSIN